MQPIERELRQRARKLRAARPGVELHQAHPAIGFSATLATVPKRLSERRLNWRWAWRSWTPEEREEVAADFFRTLLERLAAEDELAFEVWTPAGDPTLLDALAPHAAFVDRDAPGAEGPLTPAAIECLVAGRLGETLIVERDGLVRFVACGGWNAAGVWMTMAEAEQLELELRASRKGLELMGVRPGHRLHQVHPTIGVRCADDDHLMRLDERALGLEWLALSADERRQRERDMLGELLVYAREQGATVAAEPAATDALMAARDDGAKPVLITVGDQMVIESWEPRETGVWVAPEDAGALQQRLMDAWWEPWRRRAAGSAHPAPRDGGRVSRRTRAYAMLWGPWVARFGVLAGILLIERRLDWPWPIMVAVVVAGIAVLIAIESALTRWHERG